MAHTFHNVVIHPSRPPRDVRTLFRTLSRTDRPIEKTHPDHPKRTPPRCCPLCGTTDSHPGLFIRQGDKYECSVCHVVIGMAGNILKYPVSVE